MTNVGKVIIGTVTTAAAVAGAGCALVYKFVTAAIGGGTTATDDFDEVTDVTPTEENSETNNDVETDVTE